LVQQEKEIAELTSTNQGLQMQLQAATKAHQEMEEKYFQVMKWYEDAERKAASKIAKPLERSSVVVDFFQRYLNLLSFDELASLSRSSPKRGSYYGIIADKAGYQFLSTVFDDAFQVSFQDGGNDQVGFTLSSSTNFVEIGRKDGLPSRKIALFITWISKCSMQKELSCSPVRHNLDNNLLDQIVSFKKLTSTQTRTSVLEFIALAKELFSFVLKRKVIETPGWRHLV
jgi:hypothetical protein